MKKQMSKGAPKPRCGGFWSLSAMTALAVPLLAVLLTTAPAFAIDVPKGQTGVKIPVAIEVAAPIAGAEIGFTQTAGLSFKNFELSAATAGAQTVTATRDGVTWVGFFSDANVYGSAAGGRLDTGYLVFEYTGDAENTVTLTATAAYTVANGKSTGVAGVAGGTVTVRRAPDTPDTPSTPSNPSAPSTSGGASGSPGDTDKKEDDGFVVELKGNEAFTAATEIVTFSDLSRAEWAKEAIEYMATNKGILGMGGGVFAPNAEVTRAQFARFVVAALGIERGTTPAVFTDVPEDAWYFADVTALAEAGILTGYGDGRFGPDDKISREQMATIIDRALAAKGVALKDTRVFDLTDQNAASSYAKTSIEKLYGAGVINGMGDGNFAPKATATRAQACVILYNALGAAELL
jgi:hypothetical protein